MKISICNLQILLVVKCHIASRFIKVVIIPIIMVHCFVHLLVYILFIYNKSGEILFSEGNT